MARSLNKVMLIGNVGADPKISMTSNQNKVAIFSIATTTDWKDANGMRQSRTEWHHVVAWQWLADIVESYVKKGSRIYIEGHLQNRSYIDKNNIERQITEVVASEIILLGGGTSGFGAPQDFSGQQGDGMYGGQQGAYPSTGGYQQNSSYQSSGMQRNNNYSGSYNQQFRSNISSANRNAGTQFSGDMVNPLNTSQSSSQVNNGSFLTNATSAGVGNSTNRAAVGATTPTIAGFESQQSQQNSAQPAPSVNNVQSQSVSPVSSADAISGGIDDEEDIPF